MECSPDIQTLWQSAPLISTLLTGKMEVLGQKPVPVPLHPPHISNGLICGRNRIFGVTVPTINRLSHGTAFKKKKNVHCLLTNASRFPKEHCFLEDPQAAPLCASGNSNMKMNVKHRWNTDGNINLLQPTGHMMHQQFNIQQLYVLPTLYLCVLYLSENKQQLVLLTA